MRTGRRLIARKRSAAAAILLCGLPAAGLALAVPQAVASTDGGATIEVTTSHATIRPGEAYTITTSGRLPAGAVARHVAVFLDRVPCPATQQKASDYEIGGPTTDTVPAGPFKIAQHYTDSSGASKDYFCAYATFTSGSRAYEIHAGVKETWSS